MAALYRLRQLARALFGAISSDDRAELALRLTPGERALFEQMARFDQRHCLDVYQTLLQGGHSDPALLQAALLHDTGKVSDRGRPIPLLFYGVFVVLLRLGPGLYRRAARHGRGVLWPFAVHAAHGERSATMAARAGSSPEVVTILRDYAAARPTAATQALGWADNQN